MKISNTFPPNINEIRKVLVVPKGMLFTYGDTIYNPNNGNISPDMLIHEEMHCEQQKKDGPEFWWKKYLLDAQFRLSQELEAYKHQYCCMTKIVKDRNALCRFLILYARHLSDPAYGKLIPYHEALELIRGKK